MDNSLKKQPTYEQRELFARFFGCARLIYNWGLGLKNERYKSAKAFLPYEELAPMLTVLKQAEDRKWVCPQCGKVLDRDINAAKNIRDVALAAESEKSPSESGDARKKTRKRTWRESVMNPTKRQDNKSCEAQ